MPAAPTEAKTMYTERLQRMMAWLREQGIDWLWLPASDRHLNEYLPEAWKRRDWLCGFTGSAGELLLGPEQGWLFVDGRYHEQADSEVPLELIRVSKLGRKGEPTLKAVLEKSLQEKKALTVGLDADTLSAQQVKLTLEPLQEKGLRLRALPSNPVDSLRAQIQTQPDASQPFSAPIYLLQTQYTGSTIAEKLTKVRAKLTELAASALPVTKLDEVAWLFNLRGSEIAYNPVFMAYALVEPEACSLFCDASRLTAEARQALEEASVTLLAYSEFHTQLEACLIRSPDTRVAWTPSHHTYATFQLMQQVLPDKQLINSPLSIIDTLKAHKTEAELQAMRLANLRSSRAKCRLMAWLGQQAQQGQALTEAMIATQLESLYQQERDFLGLSFTTIAGSGAASSIVHYGTPDAERLIQPGEFILLDSGAQYMGGTTDDTRTLTWGASSNERQRFVFTQVLKAYLAGSSAIFPAGTTGQAIDAITRAPLWQAGLDYTHGTGHGVGAHLNVHEGPNGIHKRATYDLAIGQINSIEPGYYEPGWGGIRLENLVEVISAPLAVIPEGSAVKEWLAFAPLTYIPFERSLIEPELLSRFERERLRAYYQAITEKVYPLLEEPYEREWLLEQTSWLAEEP